MSWRFGGIEQRLTCPHVSDVVHAQTWVLEQVADLVIDLERPVIVKEIGIKPFHCHPYSVLQMTTDDYGAVSARFRCSDCDAKRAPSAADECATVLLLAILCSCLSGNLI